MRLLWVSVHGFKAYKNLTKIELHPGANAIIGLNGSGKSSLLEAITLVVSEIYGRRVVDVKSVFHHGVRNPSLSATIELCFDNQDRRLAMYDFDQVILSRKFISGSAETRKDQFLVMGKPVTKQEFASILENGGFSKTNPYYVIRQGKIMEMATMTDEGRMKLLKDFSGVQVYEDKRRQALSTLQMAQQKAKDADMLIENLESRLKDLQEQHREVCEYESLVRLADVYRVVVNELDLASLDEQISNLDQEVATVDLELTSTIAQNEQDRDDLRGQKEQIRNAEKMIEEYRDRLETVVLQHRTSKDRERILRQTLERNQQFRQSSIKKMTSLSDRIDRSQSQLGLKQEQLREELKPELVRVEERLKNLSVQRADIILQRQNLNAKLERCSQFKSVKDRNAHISKQIKIFEAKIASEHEVLDAATAQIELLNEKILKSTDKARLEEQVASLAMRETELTLKVQQLSRHRGELGRKEENLQQQVRVLTRQNDGRAKQEALSNLQRACRWSTWRGNLVALAWAFGAGEDVTIFEKVVSKIAEWKGASFDVSRPPTAQDPRVFGPLWALVKVPVQCRKAAAQAIGLQVDNLLVWDDEVASSIHQELRKGQGSATVTPLNQVLKRGPPRTPKFPKGVLADPSAVLKNLTFDKYDAVPLTALLETPDFLRPAVDAVTSRWLVCRNLDVGRRLCQSSDFDCVTVDGDKITSRGALQGGHLAPAGDVFSLGDEFGRVVEQSQLKGAKLGALQAQVNQLVVERANCNAEVNNLTEQLHLLDQEKADLQAMRDSGDREQTEMDRRFKNLTHKTGLAEASVRGLEQTIRDLRAVSLSNDLEKVDKKDQQMISELTSKEETLSTEHAAALEKFDDLQRLHKVYLTDILALEHQLEKNQQELTRLKATDGGDGTAMTDEMRDLEEAVELRQEMEAREEQGKVDLKHAEAELQAVTRRIDRAQEKLDLLMSRTETLSQAKELALKKKQTLELKRAQQLSDRQNVIMQAGQTDEEIDKLRGLPPKRLRQMLHDVDVKLSKAPRVNQKALGDLITFQNELQTKLAQRADLLDGLRSVQELMLALDERRSRTLRNQFDKVNANLQTVFAKIVPGGRAKLVIKKLSDEKIEALKAARRSMQMALMDHMPTPSTPDDAAMWRPELPAALHWDEIASGIEVKASFRPATEAGGTEYFPLVALSGGQKTVVALSLIFAMQRCDRAPFYVLDEADAALDEAYRAAVARLVQETARDSQYLLTTFRRELCEVCDKHFHVQNVDRVAQVSECDVSTALAVILEDAQKTAAAVALEDAPQT